MDKSKIQTIDKKSPLYPAEWQALQNAPQTLYALGDTRLLQTRKITVVGSRKTPAAALKTGANIVKELSMALTIATGTAEGGDGAAIEGALAGSGNVICLLAGGFSAVPQGNYALLKRVASKGLLLSPHEYDTPIREFSYAYRNKLLAALGEATLVLGAPQKSGALTTAEFARGLGRQIFALPYAPATLAGEGCNALIKQGAHLTETAEDVAKALQIPLTAQRRVTAVSADEEKLLFILRERLDVHVSELSQSADMPLFKTKALLAALEVKGLIVGLGGNRYAPV